MSVEYNLKPGQLIKWKNTYRRHYGVLDSRPPYHLWGIHDEVHEGIVIKENRFSIWVYPEKTSLEVLFNNTEPIELNKSKIILVEDGKTKKEN